MSRLLGLLRDAGVNASRLNFAERVDWDTQPAIICTVRSAEWKDYAVKKKGVPTGKTERSLDIGIDDVDGRDYLITCPKILALSLVSSFRAVGKYDALVAESPDVSSLVGKAFIIGSCGLEATDDPEVKARRFEVLAIESIDIFKPGGKVSASDVYAQYQEHVKPSGSGWRDNL